MLHFIVNLIGVFELFACETSSESRSINKSAQETVDSKA